MALIAQPQGSGCRKPDARAARGRRARGAPQRHRPRAHAGTPAASSCRGPTRSRARSATTRASRIKNPDTGLFMRYRLAGAYDSNIALLLATGDEPRRELASAGRDPAPHHAARHRPRHQPRVPLRPGALVPGARSVGQADHQVRRALPDAGRPARAGGAVDRPRLRLPADRPKRARRRRGARGAATPRAGARAQGDAARAADPAAVRGAALPLGLAQRSTGATSRSTTGASSGSATRSRCWPRPTACCTWTTRDARRRAPHLGPRPRAARHRARLLRRSSPSASRRASPGPTLDRRAARADARLRPRRGDLGARPRRPRGPSARPRDPGAAAA